MVIYLFALHTKGCKILKNKLLMLIELKVCIIIILIIILCVLFQQITEQHVFEGADVSGSLQSTQYYVLRTVVSQITKDDPEFKYQFDISALLQLPFISTSPYSAILNSSSSIENQIKQINTLLDEEPAKVSLAKTLYAC